jgi:ribosomal protein S12 methylthiotransferase
VEGAAANELPDPVPEEIKQERFDRFMLKQQAISAERLREKVGREIEVIVDAVDANGAVGRSTADAPEIDGRVHMPGATDLSPGDWVRGVVSRSDEYDLWID